MKKIYKNLLALVFAFSISATSFGAIVIVKTMPLGESISTSGVVRLVVKLTDDAIGPDIGFTLHEVEPAAPWNDAMAIGMFDFVKNSVGGIHLAGYNAGAWDWENNVKAVEKSKAIAIWITIDAVNQTHGLSAQMEGETEVTTIYADYGDRESLNANTATVAKFCSVFVNDKAGQATTAIEVIKDAEIVSSIEAFDFSSLGTAIASNNITPAVSVYPTLAQDILNISSAVEISSVKIYSLLGQEVFSGSDSKQIPVSALNSGTYIVEVKTVNNLVSRKKFLKN